MIIDGKQHNIEINQRFWVDRIEVSVDDKIVEIVTGFAAYRWKIRFEVAGKPAMFISRSGLIWKLSWDLYADGEKI